jgi:hypothetical protein
LPDRAGEVLQFAVEPIAKIRFQFLDVALGAVDGAFACHAARATGQLLKAAFDGENIGVAVGLLCHRAIPSGWR